MKHVKTFESFISDKNLDSAQRFVPVGIKPGVEELFNSSPELANQVYEALGLGKFRVTLGKELNPEQKFGSQGEPVVKKFEVLDENKDVIGTVTLDVAKDGSITAHPTLTKIGKGYGQELYQIISLKFGAPVIEWGPHNISKSPEGKKLWNSLEKKGLAKAKYQWDDNIYLRGIDLSQQKQQAQQLYSQYLDTIFPDSKVKDIVYHGTTASFDAFMKMHNNIHFGTLKAAQERLSTIQKQRRTSSKNIYSVILDIKNPIITDADFDWELDTAGEQPDPYELIKTVGYLDNWLYENGYLPKEESDIFGLPDKSIPEKVNLWKNHDSYVYKNFVEDKGSLSYNVYEPEQIHILGSKQDAEGFKRFVQKQAPSEAMFQLGGAGVSSKASPKSHRLLDYITENVIKLTQDEKSQVNAFVNKIEKYMLSGDFSDANVMVKGAHGSEDEFEGIKSIEIGELKYLTADKKGAVLKVYLGDFDSLPERIRREEASTFAYYRYNDPKNLEDGQIVINACQFKPYANGEYPEKKREKLRSALTHEVIHAKDPRFNHLRGKKEHNKDYAVRDEEIKAFSAQFIDMIENRIERWIEVNNGRMDDSDKQKEVDMIGQILNNLLLLFARKVRGGEMNVNISEFIEDFKLNIDNLNRRFRFGTKEFDNFNKIGVFGPLSLVFGYLVEIRRKEPKRYRKFLGSLYKSIVDLFDKVNKSIEKTNLKPIRVNTNLDKVDYSW